MKIIDALKRRSENAGDNVKIDLKLYNLAHTLEKKARDHLKRIITVLVEFDIHDEKHSDKVIENIELLLGPATLDRLSGYELFLLHLSAFFHDCAMAPSDWEINVLKLTEGNANWALNDFSIRHDLKAPLKPSEARKIIENKKGFLYKAFEGDVKKWMFSPATERELVDYLSDLLIEYQNYRNGFADKLRNIGDRTAFEDLTSFIRMDYIRATHHVRIEKYIQNLQGLFSAAFEQPAWGKKLALDLSAICRAHGEDAEFMNGFNTKAQYYGPECANLQFVAVMLRLGDVIHFSYDRAPIDLRSSHLFKSEYSFQQWAIKNNGTNYVINNGRISFTAYCETPETYFKLHQYIDWIEMEIQHYFRFQRQWNVTYIADLQDKVDRENILNDQNVFFPRRELSFSLNQKRILELLMGVGLYKDKYACLRELYQNSLDACRCMISQQESVHAIAQGLIEFGIERDGKKTYLYCLDNGIGMTKQVIEDYLLKIGNSYYKSADFFKQQAQWGGRFTPTSQFGIGILSCFMIGSKIEITTKTAGGEYISCSIDGLHEYFYYRNTLATEQELLPVSGTKVKILLSEDSVDELKDEKLEKLWSLFFGEKNTFPEEYTYYEDLLSRWESHLYYKMHHLASAIPSNMKVFVRLSDGTALDILTKPFLLDSNNSFLDIDPDDFQFIESVRDTNDFYNSWYGEIGVSYPYEDVLNSIERYSVCVEVDDAFFRSVVVLPKRGFVFKDIKALDAVPIIWWAGICIDGINVTRTSLITNPNEKFHYSRSLIQCGMLDFTGEVRPQLSVDRTDIVKYPDACEETARKLSLSLLQEIVKIGMEHIARQGFSVDDWEYDLTWQYLVKKFNLTEPVYINELSSPTYSGIHWARLGDMLDRKMSIRDFLLIKDVTIGKFAALFEDHFLRGIVVSKLFSSDYIAVSSSQVHIRAERQISIPKIRANNIANFIIMADEWNPEEGDYDLITRLDPLVPQRIFNLISNDDNIVRHRRAVNHYSYHAGLNALFRQSPLAVHKSMGLYEDEYIHERSRYKVHEFPQKISFNLKELIQEGPFCEEERYVLFAYISPTVLTPKQEHDLQKFIETDREYVKGVTEGWSLLITGMEIDNVVIQPGRADRQELVAKLSDKFWNTYADYKLRFSDGSEMNRPG